MTPVYVPVLRAKEGEFQALAQISTGASGKMLPIFELPKLTDKIRGQARYKGSSSPMCDYLDTLADQIAAVRKGQSAGFDMFAWSPRARTEHGEHALSYMYGRLEAKGVKTNPVVGYDRWGDDSYKDALSSLPVSEGRCFCIRLDSYAIEDAKEPEYFEEQLEDILTVLDLSPACCSVLIDFGDVTHRAVEDIQSDLDLMLGILEPWQFQFVSVAGCSLPASVADAVKRTNSSAKVLRREMVVWRSARLANPSIPLVFGDYGVRSPSAMEDVIAPHTNGKIRYTIDQHYFVVRGHSIQYGDKGAQTHALAKTVIASPYYLGEGFSWGDARIMACSKGEFKGGGTQWIAIDTNHHIETVVAEIFEFERQLVALGSTTSEPVAK